MSETLFHHCLPLDQTPFFLQKEPFMSWEMKRDNDSLMGIYNVKFCPFCGGKLP